jgi:hypothetical protein
MNLPARSKMVEPHFAMLWAEAIPKLGSVPGVEVAVVAGRVEGTVPALPPPCPPNSWAAQPGSNVGIVTIKLMPGATWTLPPATVPSSSSSSSSSPPPFTRCLYFFAGSSPCQVAGQSVPPRTKIDLDPSKPAELHNPLLPPTPATGGASATGYSGGGGGGDDASEGAMEFLLLEGRPIGEPVAQHGPFVMNDREGIMQAFADYQVGCGRRPVGHPFALLSSVLVAC